MNDFLKIRKAVYWSTWSVDWIENGFKQKEKTQRCDTREEAVQSALAIQLANPQMGIQTRDKACRNLLRQAKTAALQSRIPIIVARKRSVAVCDLNKRANKRVRKQQRMRAIWRAWLRWQAEQVPDRTKARLGEVFHWSAWQVNETLNLATTDAKKAYKDVQEGVQ